MEEQLTKNSLTEAEEADIKGAAGVLYGGDYPVFFCMDPVPDFCKRQLVQIL